MNKTEIFETIKTKYNKLNTKISYLDFEEAFLNGIEDGINNVWDENSYADEDEQVEAVIYIAYSEGFDLGYKNSDEIDIDDILE